MVGLSTSTNTNTQEANQFISQQFIGDCESSCQAVTDNVKVVIRDSKVKGGINIKQKCSLNANCAISGVASATGDVLFKALQSANAANATPAIPTSFFNDDAAYNISSQYIRQSINQQQTQKCTNNVKDVVENVYIGVLDGSTLDGGINIDQKGSTTSSCALDSSMDASLKATGLVDQKAISGKDKKGQMFSMITWIAIAGAVVAVAGIIAFLMKRTAQSTAENKSIERAASMRAKTACMEKVGTYPYKDPDTGDVYIDPVSLDPVCVPDPDYTPKTQQPIVIQLVAPQTGAVLSSATAKI